MLVKCRQRRNSKIEARTKEVTGERRTEELRFVVLSENYAKMDSDVLIAIKENTGNKVVHTEIEEGRLREKQRIIHAAKSKGFKKGGIKGKGKGVGISNGLRDGSSVLKPMNKQPAIANSADNPFSDGSVMGPKILDKELDAIVFQLVGKG